MKRNVLMALVALTVGMGMTGCKNYSSPKGVAMTAAQALKKQDLKLWKSTLIERAAEDYGSPEGMGQIGQVVAGYEKLTWSKAAVIDRKQGPHGDVENTYTMDVFGSDKEKTKLDKLATLTTFCTTVWTYDTIPGHGGPHRTPPIRRWTAHTTCKISNIAL
ncbi:MAG: hypothetical protein AB7F66_02870 [Bacteriovoracia bacterium]